MVVLNGDWWTAVCEKEVYSAPSLSSFIQFTSQTVCCGVTVCLVKLPVS